MKKGINSNKLVLFFCYFILCLFAILCLIPFIMTISISFSSERAINANGFSILPKEPTLNTYKYLLQSKGSMILNSYGVTFFNVIFGTIYSLAITTMYAYAASNRKQFRFARALSFIAWFTMVFNGGMLPWYILVTKYYHLKNTMLAMILPYGMNVFYMFVMRNTFSAIPDEIEESAKIDGAGTFKIFFSIMLPLCKTGLVTLILFYALIYWNDFYLAMMLITDQAKYPLQMLLYAMQSNIQFLVSGGASNLGSGVSIEVPMTTSRMAMTCLTIGPVILFYPFAQKYFVKGMIVGAVKG